MCAAPKHRAKTPATHLVPTTTPQAKRLALLHGPDSWWKPALTYGLSYPALFDIPRLELTLRFMARRHSGLRIYFLPDQSIDVAGCLPADEATWPLRVVDLGPAARADCTRETEAFTWLQRPFDPFERPLLRALLLRRGEEDLLGLAIDHSLFDGYSARILREDFAHVYNGLSTRPTSAFDRLQSDAVQCARDERQWLDSAEGAAALSWWDNLNAGLGAYPPLELPESAPYEPTADNATYGVELSADDVSRVRRGSADLRVSAFMMAAAATCVTFREVGPSDDIAFLFASARRTWPSMSKAVTYMANRSLIRVTTGRNDNVSSVAHQVRARTVEAIQHGMFSHEQYLRIRFPGSFDRKPKTAHGHLNVMAHAPLPRLDGRPVTQVPLPGGHDYPLPGIGISVPLNIDGTGGVYSSYPGGMYDRRFVEELTQAIARRFVTRV